jgi:hypothetical protein
MGRKIPGLTMTQFKKTEDGSSIRNELLKALALSLRALAIKDEVDTESKDLIAFIILLLNRMTISIDTSVSAWEKRDYWVKADRFRLEWEWCTKQSSQLTDDLLGNNWNNIPNALSILSGKCSKIKLSAKILKTKPWIGAYEQFKKELN